MVVHLRPLNTVCKTGQNYYKEELKRKLAIKTSIEKEELEKVKKNLTEIKNAGIEQFDELKDKTKGKLHSFLSKIDKISDKMDQEHFDF